MEFNPTDHPEFSVFFSRCTAELKAHRWYVIEQQDPFAELETIDFDQLTYDART
jgi:hypothetical protein